jgi:hypothetical protein
MLLSDTADGQKWRKRHGEERAFLLGMALYLRNNPGETEVPLQEAARYSGCHPSYILGTANVLNIDGLIEIRSDSGQEMLSLAGDAMSFLLTGDSLLSSIERRHGDLRAEEVAP